MPDSRLAPLLVNREEDNFHGDKSLNPQNIKNKISFTDYSKRLLSFNEQQMWQRDDEYLKRKKVYGEYVVGAHQMKEHLSQREREKPSIDAPHDLFQNMQHYNDMYRTQHLQHLQKISQQREKWQPGLHHMPLLPQQDTEHLKQPLLPQQLHCREKWQTELQMHHFKKQEKLQRAQCTVQQHPQLAERKNCENQEGLQHQYQSDQMLQREGITKQKEPNDMKEEVKYQQTAYQKIDELHRPWEASDEKPLGKHEYGIEQEQFCSRQRLNLFKQQPITQRSEKSVEDKEFIGSPNRSCFESRARLHVYEPPNPQSPLRSQLPKPDQNHRSSEYLGDKMHENHSQMPCSDVQLKARDISPCFDTSIISGRPVAKSNSDSYNNIGAICHSCGKKAMFLCSRCRNAWYCSDSCQVKYDFISLINSCCIGGYEVLRRHWIKSIKLFIPLFFQSFEDCYNKAALFNGNRAQDLSSL